MGLDIPKIPGTDQVDVKKLMKIEITLDDPKDKEQRRIWSPLKSEKPSASVI